MRRNALESSQGRPHRLGHRALLTLTTGRALLDIVISPSIIDRQQMLIVCSATAKSLVVKLNGNKSHCLSLGKLANVDIGSMVFDNQSIMLSFYCIPW